MKVKGVMGFFRKIFYFLARVIFDPPALVCILISALIQRARPRREKPAIFWGTIPANIIYHSRSAKMQGYTSVTVVRYSYYYQKQTDFDHDMVDLLDRCFLMRPLPILAKRFFSEYATFLWALPRFDIFMFYFGGTILKYSSLQKLELQLLHLAGKKTVFMAYGADVAVNSRARGLFFKHANAMDYPEYVRTDVAVERNLFYASKHADHIISGVDWVDFMPWWDQLIAGHFSIDTELWQPAAVPPARSGDKVVVLHAPNHRELKGTRFLIKACEELIAEGVPLELKLVEKVSNEEIRVLMDSCDIIADQFIIGWYAMFAIEGMSRGKPVMAYLRQDLLDLYTLFSYAGECPIVNTYPTKIKETLRMLVENPQLREELGKRGRPYVQEHHSLEALGVTFDAIFRKLWSTGK
jgi:glycosyltransferase involved in cell wall biosynthesis